MTHESTNEPVDVFLAALEEVARNEPHSAVGTVSALIGSSRRQQLAEALAGGRFNLDLVPQNDRLSMGVNYICTFVISTEEHAALTDASMVHPNQINGYFQLMLTQVFLTCILTSNRGAMTEIAQVADIRFIVTRPNSFELMYEYIDSRIDLPFSWWLKLVEEEQP